MKTHCICSNGDCSWSGIRIGVRDIRCILENEVTTTVITTTVTETPIETECPALTEENGEWECNNSNLHASKCQLHCIDGWKQVRTVIKCKCDETCEWLRPLRTCEPEQVFQPTSVPAPAGGICSPLSDSVGTWHCSKDSNVGSRCKLTCPAEYVFNSRHISRRCRCSSRQDVGNKFKLFY